IHDLCYATRAPGDIISAPALVRVVDEPAKRHHSAEGVHVHRMELKSGIVFESLLNLFGDVLIIDDPAFAAVVARFGFHSFASGESSYCYRCAEPADCDFVFDVSHS